MQEHCLYCGADAITRIAEVEVARLIEVYRKGFGVDVERLFSDTSARLTLVSCRTCELRWFSPLVAGDDRFYEDLQKLSWYYQDDKPEYGYASQHILPGDAVLEVGCGKGAFAPFLANGVQYRGLEFNRLAVDKARGAGLDVEACSIAAEAERVPASYDVVCHFQVLEHVSAPRAFLVDCVRALRPGGRLIITVPSEDSFLSIAEDAWLNMPPHHVTRWTDSALAFALAKLQLEAQEIWHEPVASFHAAWYRDVLINFGVKRLLGGRTVLASTHRGRRIARLGRLLGKTRCSATGCLPRASGLSPCATAATACAWWRASLWRKREGVQSSEKKVRAGRECRPARDERTREGRDVPFTTLYRHP